jgi:hypothetical protein
MSKDETAKIIRLMQAIQDNDSLDDFMSAMNRNPELKHKLVDLLTPTKEADDDR